MGFFKNMMSTFTNIDDEAQSLDEKIVGKIAGNFQEKRMNEAGYGTAYSIPEEFKHFPQFNGSVEYMIVKDEDGLKKCGVSYQATDEEKSRYRELVEQSGFVKVDDNRYEKDNEFITIGGHGSLEIVFNIRY